MVTRLNTEFNKALQRKEVRDNLLSQGAEPLGGTAAELGTYIRTEIPKWRKIIKESAARAD
ncbi:Tripartite tricarboxylate transporter family receptor [compost metagenome]